MIRTRVWLVAVGLLVGTGWTAPPGGGRAGQDRASAEVDRVLAEVDSACQALPMKTTDLLRGDEDADREALGNIAGSVLGRLLKVLKQGSGERARIRGVIADRGADWRLRTILALAVRAAGDQDAAPVLTRIVRDQEAPLILRDEAAAGLVELAGYEGGRVVTEVLRDTATPQELQAELVTWLAMVGSDDVDLLTRVVKGSWAVSRKHPGAPLRAVDALGHSRNPAATATLLALGRGTPSGALIRGVIAEALGRRKATEALPWLEEVAVGDRDSSNRQDAVTALGVVGDRRAVPGLLKALEDPSSGVVWPAAVALGKLRARDAAPALRALAEGLERDPRFASHIDPKTGREWEGDVLFEEIRKAYRQVSR